MALLKVNDDGTIGVNKKKKKRADLVVGSDGKITVNREKFNGLMDDDDDIAPVKPVTKSSKERSWFDLGLFDDGYDVGDITKTILGTAGDVGLSVMRGVGNAGEGVGSLLAGGVAQVADWIGQDEYAEKVRGRIAGEDEETNEFLEKFGANSNYKRMAGALGVDDTSLLGEKSKDLGASAGNLFAAMAGQAVGVPWYLTMGGSAAGGELENAYKSGATDGEAWLSAGVSGVSEVLIEKLTGGISFGGKTLDDLWKKPLTKAITNKTANLLRKFGRDAAGEGFEEVLTEAVQSLGRLSYEHDKTWEEALFSEESLDNYLEAFIGGAVLGGGFNAKKAYNSVKTGRDYDTGLTDNEQTVVNSEITNRTTEIQKQRAVEQQINRVIEEREKTFGTLNDTEKRNIKKQIQERLDNGELDYSTTELSKKEITKIESEVMEDLKNGSFSIDTIEDALVGDKTARLRELNQTLSNTTDEAKKAEIEAEINQINVDKATQLKELLSKDVILQESYRQESLKKQEFDREVTETDSDITKELIESAKAVKMNNTRKMHNLFEYTNKIANDSGTKYGFVNNDQLKELGHDVEGKTVNGLVRVNKDGSTKVLINVDSEKALNTIIGHETTHLLEDTKEYKALQNIVKEYATTKGDYDGRFKELSKLYEGTNADVESEVTADLVGDYLFTDEEFINNLSAKEPNVFKKVYDYIKHVYKMATVGSKEARQLEQVKRRFDKAYKEMSKTTTGKTESNLTTEADSDTKLSLSEEDKKYTSAVESGDMETAQKMVDEAANKAFKNSVARDGNGKLLKVYHGSGEKFNVFRGKERGSAGNYFSPWKNVAEGYGDVRAFYVNLTNPMEYDEDFEQINDVNESDADGFIYLGEDIRDGFDENLIGDTEIVVYDSSKIKSADPVTYDDEGNVIPLSKRFNAGNEDVRYSLSDSQGRKLTKEQQEYFKDSKVRDENGSLMVMYHGTPDGRFTVFKDGSYFTESKDYADRYQNTNASSIGSGKVAESPKTFEVYLNIKKPFDINDPEARKIYINDYIKGGNALGINPYLSDAEYNAIETIDWTEGEDLRDFLIENEYDYDGLVLDEGADGGYGEDVKYRGKSYVVFNPEQVKKVDNTKPTSDPDIRFSLSAPVEETKDLMAIHNLHVNEVLKQLDLGGMPMPSVAITDPSIVDHEGFGDVTLILHKDAIDPKKNKDNKVYSGDAYTPTFPPISYKANEVAAKNIENRVRAVFDDIPDYYRRGLASFRDIDNINHALNSAGGEQGLIERYKDTHDLKQLYLAEKGEVVPVVVEEIREEMDPFKVDSAKAVIEALGEDTVRELIPKTRGPHNIAIQKEWADKHQEELKEVYTNLFIKDGFSKEDAKGIVDEQKISFWLVEGKKAAEYLQTGGVTVKRKEDFTATNSKIDSLIPEEDYQRWVKELFTGIEGVSGIRNKKDTFTPAGNRRSFEALHDPITLENIVKAMRGDELQKGQAALGGNLSGASAREYKSIKDIKNDSQRLGKLTKEEHDANNQYISDTLNEIAQRYANGKDWWDARNTLVEAVALKESKQAIKNYLKQYDYVYKTDDYIVDDLIELRDYVRGLTVPYFEAKPRRAVGFDEVGVFVIPNNADATLKQKLLEAGYAIAEYNPEIEGDRQNVVNRFEEYKFSLSKPGEDIAPVGNYNVYGRDVKLQEDIAPVKETISKTEIVEDLAPVKTVEPEEDDELSRPLTEEDLYLVEQERDEAFRNISDDYLPAEESEYYNAPDTSPIDDDYLRLVTKNMRQGLGLKNNQMAAFRKIVQDFSTSEDQSLESLYAAIEKEFGTVNEKKKLEDVATIKATLRSMRIKVSDTIKGDIPDYAKWKQKQFGKVRITNDGMDVDDVYEGLKDYFPDFFPSEIINPTDQLLRIAEVMDMDATVIEEYALPEEQIQDVADFIYEAVYDYKQQKRRDDAIAASKAPIDESMIPYDETLSKKDIAPVKSNFDSHDFTVSRGVQQKYDLESGEITENERDAEIERLERKKKQALEDLGDLPTFTKRKANELYDEVRMMTKGQRVSTDLGFILDRMFSGVSKQDPEYETIKDGIYKNITDALLNIEMNPVQPETSRPYAETIIRNAIEKRYTWTVDDINSWELDPISKTRRELRKALIGKDPDFLDKALENAKNVPMALMNNTDTIRNTELVFGRENGRVINDLIFQKAIDNESKSIAWQNKERAEIAALGIKAKDKYGRVTKESEAVQKYGEGKYLDDTGDYVIYDDAALERDFPNPDDRAKIIGAARAIREKYDNYIDTANDVLTSLGFEAIPKRDDYFRHFQALNDVFSNFGIPFNPESMTEHTLPTDINGLTEFWSPQKNYFANIQPRKGMRTTFDAITGIDGYISGIANLIYHTEDIQRGRALEDLIRETYGETKGWDNLASLPEEQQAARAEKIQDNHLSNYAAWVHEWTNNMAGKKNKIDRSIESMFGRKAFSFLDETRKQVGSNMIGLNLASSLTNLISPVQAIAKTNKLAVAKGTADTIKNIFVKDTFMEDNSFLTARMGTDMLSKTAWEKMRDAGYVFMKGMDWFSSNQIVRSKFYELKAKGLTDAEAHAEAGKFAARIMGDRTKGANAQLYNSKIIGLVTQFQLEVNNQLYSMFYDTYHESKEQAKNDARKTAAGMTFVLGQMFALTHLFGKTFESIAGYNPTFDVIGILATALGAGDDEEDKPVSERLKDAADKLVDALPYVNILTGGGRIPITSGIPNLVGVATGGKDDYGNELTWKGEFEKLLYLVPPTGGGQIKKTSQGLAMFDSDNPVTGSYTDSGNLRFPVENTPLNVLQAGLFGQWASGNARDYFNNERKPLGEKQIQEYKDLDIPIKDYWKYREDLKDQKTLEEKFDYIADLDLPVSKKNIMINNIVDRKEAVDMTNYDQFGSYEEFDWATKNPEKYAYFESIGVSYKQYNASEESKDAYNWAYNNPEKYSLAKAAAGDVVKYRSYVSGLSDLKADKDSNGKTITGSRKVKVANYINGLDADYGSKLILFKSEYPSDDRYNYEIIEYLNNRQDISYDEMVTILRGLDFTVDANGNVTW